LSKEDRLLRVKEILENNHIKQKLCNLVQGLTFKDIDRAMKDIIAERQPTEAEQEELELREIAPEKFEPPIPALLRPDNTQSTHKIKYTTYTREQITWLFAQSEKSVQQEPIKEFNTNYKTYTPEEVAALIKGDYGSKKNSRK